MRIDHLSRICLVFFIGVLQCSSASAQQGGTFTVTKNVIAAGGGRVSGGSFAVDGTIGQPLAGAPSSGAAFTLISGFWGGGSSTVPSLDAPFDFDGDGKTDIG